MKMLVINNLAAGYMDGSIYDFLRSFAKDSDEIVIRNSNIKTDLREYLYDAKKYGIVVAAGGNSTVGTVSYLLANSNIPILTFPAGYNNLIAQNLLLPNEPHALALLARNCKTLDFDVGEICINNNRYGFGANTGAGYSAKISKDARFSEKHLGALAYIGAAISNFSPKMSEIELNLDGKIIKTTGVGILILNFAKIGLELSVTHTNRPRDGMLDVVVLKAKTALDYLPAFTAAALDNAIDFPDRSDALEIHSAKEVHVNSNPAMEIQTDGNILERYTPFSAKIMHLAARYVVSDQCIEQYKNNRSVK